MEGESASSSSDICETFVKNLSHLYHIYKKVKVIECILVKVCSGGSVVGICRCLVHPIWSVWWFCRCSFWLFIWFGNNSK